MHRGAMLQRSIDLAKRHGELQVNDCGLRSEVEEVGSCRGGDQLAHLSAIDSLYHQIAQGAGAAVLEEEAAHSSVTMEHLVSREAAIHQELHHQRMSLQDDWEHMTSISQARRASLDTELDRALVFPAELREALRQLEDGVASTEVQAGSAQAEAELLHHELEELRAESTSYLRSGSAQVAELQVWLEGLQGSSRALQEELRCRQLALRSHELAIEANRHDDARCELELFSHFSPQRHSA